MLSSPSNYRDQTTKKLASVCHLILKALHPVTPPTSCGPIGGSKAHTVLVSSGENAAEAKQSSQFTGHSIF